MPSKYPHLSEKPAPKAGDDIALPREDQMPQQRVVDANTGRDITGQYIREGLEKLEEIGHRLIETAQFLVKRHPDWKEQIYEDFRDWLHIVIGQGSLGPATAAAAPLMRSLQEELARRFDKE